MSQSPGPATFYSRKAVRRGKIVQDPRFKKQQETNILANRTGADERMEPYA